VAFIIIGDLPSCMFHLINLSFFLAGEGIYLRIHDAQSWLFSARNRNRTYFQKKAKPSVPGGERVDRKTCRGGDGLGLSHQEASGQKKLF